MASSVVKRYGKALLEIAKENNNAETWVKNFQDSKLILQDEDLLSFLNSPQVPLGEKYKSVDTLCKGSDRLFINFLKILISRNQVHFFIRIMLEFFEQIQKSKGKMSATVTSFVTLSTEQKNKLVEKICAIFQVKDVEIEEKLDTSILGGFIIKVGDTLIDCSTKNKLNGLQNHLLKSSAL